MSEKDDSSYELAPSTPAARPAPRPDVAPTGIPVAPPQPIQDRPCPHCGFRIMGKPRNNRCPDCNAPLDQTTSDLLQFATPAWTRTVAWGAIVIVVALGVHVAGFLVRFLNIQGIRANAVHTGAAALVFIGVWMVSARETQFAAKRSRLAFFSRLLALVVIGLWAWAIADTRARPLAHCAALIVDIGVGFTLCLYASGLSMRIPSDSLVQHFRILPYVLGLFFVALVISVVADPRVLRSYLELFFCSFPLLGIMGGIVVWLAITLLRFAIELRQTAAAAEEIVERRMRRNAPKPPAK